MDVFAHIAFALTGAAWLFKDVLLLRSLAVAASVSMIVYAGWSDMASDWVVIGWHCFFIIVNLVQLVHLVHERRGVELTGDDTQIYQRSFQGFSPAEYLKLRRLATDQQAEAGLRLTEEGQPVGVLVLVLEGCCTVSRGERDVATIEGGGFIGEMSFFRQKPASATVTTTARSRLLVWQRKDLRRLLARNPAMNLTLQALFGAALAERLGQADSVLRMAGELPGYAERIGGPRQRDQAPPDS